MSFPFHFHWKYLGKNSIFENFIKIFVINITCLFYTQILFLFNYCIIATVSSWKAIGIFLI